MTKPVESRLSSVVAIRLPKHTKEILAQEARVRKKSLSDYLFDLLTAGRQAARESGPASKAAEAEAQDLENAIPQEDSKEPESSRIAAADPVKALENSPRVAGSEEDRPVTKKFLAGIQERYPAVNFDQQMLKIEQWVKRNEERRVTRSLIEEVFEEANKRRFR
jgi:uncharacterized protein YciI